jgi:ornithine carbamoyltransferase
MKEHFGYLKGLNFVYAGDGRNNMANSLMIGSAKMGVNFTIIAPKSLWPTDELVELCKEYAKESGSTITLSEEVEAVVKETVDPEEVIETKAPKKKGFFERLFGRR